MKVLSFGTYPIRIPVHGGQRRTSQIGEAYTRGGIEYRYVCVYDAASYGGASVGSLDLAFAPDRVAPSPVPFIGDIASGHFAADDALAFDHFAGLCEAFGPDVLQVEQPFMWPLVRKLRGTGACTNTALVYSSHNFEGPLKRAILEGVGVDPEQAAVNEDVVTGLEAELAAEADLLICVSESDADHYRRLAPDCAPLVIRNGTERPQAAKRPPHGQVLTLNDYLFFVGSAYPPNIAGFETFVLRSGLYGFPPLKRFAICGGAANGIYQSQLYAPHSEAYGARAQFFPSPSDAELVWLRDNAKAILLPIATGGGSNLKTAEALTSGKWIVATPLAMRSFEEFIDSSGIIIAPTAEAFHRAMVRVLHEAPLRLTPTQQKARESLYWDRLLAEGGLAERVQALKVG